MQRSTSEGNLGPRRELILHLSCHVVPPSVSPNFEAAAVFEFLHFKFHHLFNSKTWLLGSSSVVRLAGLRVSGILLAFLGPGQ